MKNNEIVQGIFNIIVNGIEPEWRSLRFNYKVDETQSGYNGEYDSKEGTKYFRPSMLSSEQLNELEGLLQSLRIGTQELSEEPFTHCTLRFASGGEFNLEYSYEPVDWTPIRGR